VTHEMPQAFYNLDFRKDWFEYFAEKEKTTDEYEKAVEAEVGYKRKKTKQAPFAAFFLYFSFSNIFQTFLPFFLCKKGPLIKAFISLLVNWLSTYCTYNLYRSFSIKI